VAGGDPETVVALRGRRRWVQRFTRLALSALPVDGGAPTLRHRGVYLIVGELFSHGLLAASCLSEVQARLVLIGDSGLPAPETWDDWLADPGRDGEITATLTELRRLESLGCELLLCEADMANPAQVLAAVERAMARFGTLHGVFYLPVDAPPELTRTLDQLDPDFYDYRLRARLAGLAAIEEAVRGRGVELFILGAGPASLLGGRGLALEALADCALDLVARRESRRGSALWRSVGGDLFTTAATAESRWSPTTQRGHMAARR
jgi:NAD(P)-dependent dehydrogenase (short-subunit alcohol dehydrogenase family)